MSSQSIHPPIVDTELTRPPPSLDADALVFWHQQYAAQVGHSREPAHSNPAIQAVESDVLDYEWIETQLLQFASRAVVVDGFCATCQYLLDHWPDLGIGESAVGRRFHTCEIKAAARLGCRFCAFLLSRLNKQCLLETFRKIEARLQIVSDSGIASLIIQESWWNANTVKFLWISFPGTVVINKIAYGGRALCFVSGILSPPGEPLYWLSM